RNKDALGQTGIVGNRFLQNYHVTLDYPRHKLLLERTEFVEEPDDALRLSFGIVIHTDGKTVRIDHLKLHSPAQRSGVRTGDILLAINGQPVSAMTTAAIANVLSAAQEATQFQFRRGVDPNLGTGGDEYALSL